MVVYVLVCGYTDVDGGDFSTTVIGVFDTIEVAQEMLNLEIESARKDFEGYDTEEDNFVEGDMSWSIWEKGEYPSHHCDLIISEEIVLDGIAK